jgi:hypothetical protein
MGKKTIAILLVVSSSFVSSAFANSIINKLITKSSATPSIIKSHKMTKQTNLPYTDFSGKWRVNCGDGFIFSTIIENSLDYITFDGEELRIGLGLQGKYESNEENTRHEHTSLEWSADKSTLILKDVEVSKDNVDNSAIHTDISTGTYTMKNGQIIADGKIITFNDATQIEQSKTVHCVYTK